MRVVAGPACDYFGPRVTFAACLLLGAIPSALSGTVNSAGGLITLRFFIGILGGTFVPCQVWTTGFYDKNIVGTANALTAGWGNSGGGITYFVMPAVFDSLVASQHLRPHVAWRVAFIVPFIIITAVAIGMLLVCDDCPTGKWSERHASVQTNASAAGIVTPSETPSISEKNPAAAGGATASSSDEAAIAKHEAKMESYSRDAGDLSDAELLAAAKHEVVQKPTFAEAVRVTFAPQTIVVAACYVCSFGAELAINSILGAYYLKNFPALGQTGTGRWAAMFGLLNIVFRPLGGIAADAMYKATGKVYTKKVWMHFLGVMTGAFQLAIGLVDSRSHSTMFGLMAGMAFFLEAGNGANFALVPHIFPSANGVVSGMTGAAGNFGGIIFAIVFRYIHGDYAKGFWIIGVVTIAVNLAVCWIKPVPAGPAAVARK